jgi:hypothetical protein
MTTLRSITQPNYHRTGINFGVTDIPAKRIVKVDPAGGVDSILLDAAATTPIAGVTTEIIYAGKSASYQKDGKVVVTAGAAVAIGDGLTSDGSGRAIKATAGNMILGRAVTLATTLGDDIEVELGAQGNVTPA